MLPHFPSPGAGERLPQGRRTVLQGWKPHLLGFPSFFLEPGVILWTLEALAEPSCVCPLQPSLSLEVWVLTFRLL